MEVKPGYKQTEVGVIPEDWEVKPLRSCLSAQPDYGINAPAVAYSDRLPTYIRITDITEDGRFSSEKPVSVKRADTDAYYLNDGDIVFARTGASVGKSYLYEPNDGKLVFAGFLIRVRPDAVKLLPSYLSACVMTGAYWRWVRLMSMRSGQPGINGQEYGQLPIPVPPLPEQRAIATALSDVDGLLGGLDRLIAKKRDLKQAAMQQLLTGQTRLPGFHGEWEVKTLKEVCWFQEGPGVRNTQFTSSGIKLLNGTNIFRGVLNLDTTMRFISESEGRGAYAHFLADDGDIVLASSGITIERLHEKVAFVRPQDLPFCMNTSTIRFKPFKGILARAFLFQFLTGDDFKRMIGGTATGSAQLNFGPFHVEKVELSVPPLPEQTAIAEVLTDMDAELAGLTLRREKTRALKQAMMQELLTGKTRLV